MTMESLATGKEGLLTTKKSFVTTEQSLATIKEGFATSQQCSLPLKESLAKTEESSQFDATKQSFATPTGPNVQNYTYNTHYTEKYPKKT